jgi:hypothetical protein
MAENTDLWLDTPHPLYSARVKEIRMRENDRDLLVGCRKDELLKDKVVVIRVSVF